MDLTDRWERPRLDALEPSRRDMGQGDPYTLAYTRPDGTRVYVAPTCDVRAVADEERRERLARLAGHVAPDAPAAPAPEPIWSRTPTPEQLAARNAAFAEFAIDLSFRTDQPLPRIDWRWLLPSDGDPLIDARTAGCCRVISPAHVVIALRADRTPAQIFATTVHELTHAADAALSFYGMPTAMAEARAEAVARRLTS